MIIKKSNTQFWYLTTVLVCFKKSNNCLEKYGFFHETWQFFEVFEVLCEIGIYLILILNFSNTWNLQFLDPEKFPIPGTCSSLILKSFQYKQLPPHSGSGLSKLLSSGISLVEWLMILFCCNGSQINKLFHLLLPGWWGTKHY